MARLFDGTNDSLQSASTIDLSGTNVISVAFWLWWDAFDTNFDLVMECSADTNSSTTGFYFSPDNPNAGGQYDLTLKGNVGNNSALYSRTNAPAAQWNHFVLTLDKSVAVNEVNVYMNGALETAGTRPSTSNNTNNFGNDTWNIMSRNNTSLWGTGRMAELAIYPGLLGADDVASLAKGFAPPMVRPELKPYYIPTLGVDSPEPERNHGSNFTVNGATFTPHPRIIYPIGG